MNAEYPSSKLTLRARLLTEHERLYSLLPARSLVTRRRYDLAVKWRFFRHHLHGGDPAAERVYRWHITTRIESNRRAGFGMDVGKPQDASVYVEEAHKLAASMLRYGFLTACAIPLDCNGELLNGSHRTACNMAMGLETIPVVMCDRRVKAPAWGEAWFIAHGCPAEDLDRIRRDWQSLHGEAL